MGKVKLTQRQKEILALIEEKVTDKMIGRALNISDRTVEAHLRLIFLRLGVASRMEARRAAEECGEL